MSFIQYYYYKLKSSKYYNEHNYEKTIEYCNYALDIRKEEHSLFFLKAESERALCKYTSALENYKNALNLSPNDIRALLILSDLYIILGKYNEALIEIVKCIRLKKNNQHLSKMEEIKELLSKEKLLQSKINDKNFEEAEIICVALIKKSPEYLDIKFKYLEILLKNLKFDKVENQVKLYLSKYKSLMDEGELRYILAKSYFYNDKFKECTTVINELKVNSLFGLVNHNNLMSRIKELNRKLNKAIEIREVANKMFTDKKYEDAIKKYTELIEIDEENKIFNSIMLRNRALCYEQLKDYLKALKDANNCIKLNPNYAKGHLKRGMVYINLEMFTEALEDLNKANTLSLGIVQNDLFEFCKLMSEKQYKKKDYYKILDINSNADETEIKKVYKKLVLKYHPDKNNESEEANKIAHKKMVEINEAYQILSNPEEKKKYDKYIYPYIEKKMNYQEFVKEKERKEKEERERKIREQQERERKERERQRRIKEEQERRAREERERRIREEKERKAREERERKIREERERIAREERERIRREEIERIRREERERIQREERERIKREERERKIKEIREKEKKEIREIKEKREREIRELKGEGNKYREYNNSFNDDNSEYENSGEDNQYYDPVNYNCECKYCHQYGHQIKDCPKLFCNICHTRGHPAFKCPKKRCYKCGKTGHIKSNCPY